MATRSLDKLVDEYLEELLRVSSAWDRYREIERLDPGWFESDRNTEQASLDAAAVRFTPVSEDIEKTSAKRNMKSSTAPMTTLRAKLSQGYMPTAIARR